MERRVTFAWYKIVCIKNLNSREITMILLLTAIQITSAMLNTPVKVVKKRQKVRIVTARVKQMWENMVTSRI